MGLSGASATNKRQTRLNNGKDFVRAQAFAILFSMLDYEQKKKFLIEKLCFREVGTRIAGAELFVYLYSVEPVNMEIYLEKTKVSEINRYHQGKMQTLRIPYPEGLIYMMFQVYGDLNSVDFSNSDFTEEEMRVAAKFNKPMELARLLANIEINSLKPAWLETNTGKVDIYDLIKGEGDYNNSFFSKLANKIFG